MKAQEIGGNELEGGHTREVRESGRRESKEGLTWESWEPEDQSWRKGSSRGGGARVEGEEEQDELERKESLRGGGPREEGEREGGEVAQ